MTERGISRRGVRFSTGSVYEILTSSTYYGQHHFNRRDGRTGAPRPPSQWVGIQVPAIIDEGTFNQDSRRSSRAAARQTDPAARREWPDLPRRNRSVRGYCGGAMIQNTGKGGLYRYYCCSSKLKKGPSACRGLRTPMEKLDKIVVGEVARQVARSRTGWRQCSTPTSSRPQLQADGAKTQLTKLRHDHTAAAAGIARLLELVEKGLMEAGGCRRCASALSAPRASPRPDKADWPTAEPDGVVDTDYHSGKGRAGRRATAGQTL